MKRRVPAVILILAASLTGCGGVNPAKPGPPTPHGGVVVPLPEDKGLVEVVKQPAPGKAGRTVIVVYFLDNDRNPMTAAPTTATFKGPSPADKPVSFKPITGDAAKAGGLASDPINDRGDMEGDLTATVGGSPVTVSLTLR